MPSDQPPATVVRENHAAAPRTLGGLVACPDCDLLQRQAGGSPGADMRCARCGALLHRYATRSMERSLVWALTGVLLLVIANAFPMVTLEIQGVRRTMTLMGTAMALADQDMRSLAALVGATLLAAPALQLGILCYLLLPLRHRRAWPGHALLFRLLPRARPWSMVEVFMLGALVTLVKLAEIATVVPGVALGALAALMFVMAAAAASFDSHEAWDRIAEARTA
jgi:paraquat-inducible protein A